MHCIRASVAPGRAHFGSFVDGEHTTSSALANPWAIRPSLTCSCVNVFMTALSPFVSISLPCDGRAALPLLREEVEAAKGCEQNIEILQHATKINAPIGAHPRLQAHFSSNIRMASLLLRQKPFFHMELRVWLCNCGAGKCFHHGRGDCRPPRLRLDQFLLLRLALHQLSRNRSRHVRLIRDHVPRPRRWWDWLQHQQWSGQSAPEEERNQAKAWRAFSKSKHRFQRHCQFSKLLSLWLNNS